MQKHKLDVDADNETLSVCLRTWTPTPYELVLKVVELISNKYMLIIIPSQSSEEKSKKKEKQIINRSTYLILIFYCKTLIF